MISRTDESKFTDWWFGNDRKLFWSILALVGVGLIALFTAGSVAAERMNPPQEWHYFFLKSLKFYIIGLTAFFAASSLNKKWVIGVSMADVVFCAILLLITLVMPSSIKGSARWVSLGPLSIQPAELLKPGFIVMTAWFLAKMKDLFGDALFVAKEAWRPKLFSWWTYIAIFLPMIAIIITHPDVGTAVLYLMVLAAMLFLAGLPIWTLFAFGGIGAFTGVVLFFTMPHFHSRVMSFVGAGDDYQIRQSIQSIQHGGLLGQADESFVKQSLPDAHTDFVFAALAEDNGAIMACGLLALLLFVMGRLAQNASRARDKFVFYAVSGTLVLFGAQACINIASTLHIIPAKGMTLPFISYGGSSFVSFCILFGMILALIREDKWKN